MHQRRKLHQISIFADHTNKQQICIFYANNFKQTSTLHSCFHLFFENCENNIYSNCTYSSVFIGFHVFYLSLCKISWQNDFCQPSKMFQYLFSLRQCAWQTCQLLGEHCCCFSFVSYFVELTSQSNCHAMRC